MLTRGCKPASYSWWKTVTEMDSRSVRRVGSYLMIGFCLCIVAACSNLAGPEYKQPETPVKETWTQPSEPQVSAEETIRVDWWTGFGDAYLDGIIQQSISGNYDLKILAARIDQAGATIDVQRADLLPRITGTATTRFERTFSTEPLPPRLNETRQTTNVRAGLNWELDIWGKAKKGVNAAKAGYRASEWEWRAGYLTLVADVATRYFLIRQLDEQVDQQSKTQENNTKLLAIYEAQYREGILPESDVLSQRAEIASITQQLEDLRRQRQVTELSLATLLGVPAGDLHVPKAALTGTVHEMGVPPGLPSDLLTRRPDIIRQEYQVLAAHELVGQARLEKLPSISLTSDASSLASKALSNLLKTWTLGIAPSINIPIFDPKINARLKTNEARAKEEEERYRKTVITAFEEVEIALTNLASRQRQKKLLEEQIEHLNIVRQTRYAQLREGLVTQLEVFDTDRTLLAAQLAKLRTHQQILADTVTLYKALGGGWPVENVGQAGL